MNASTIKRAIKNLMSYDFVGVSEYWNESIELFYAALAGSSFPSSPQDKQVRHYSLAKCSWSPTGSGLKFERWRCSGCAAEHA